MKIKKKYFTVLLCLISLTAYPQNNSVKDRQDLQNLLQERKIKFDAYASSLEKRSGIFGNKTKKDIQSSNEVLIDIVKTDNRIISTLNRVIDFRNFEKTNMNYDVVQQNQNYDNLLRATDTLSKQVDILTATNKSLKKNTLKFEILFYAALALVICLLIIRLKKK
ncbi:MAG: hypothetical protein ABI855_16805 [Bacteroidota bacterium]